MNIPQRLTAGDSWTWTDTLSEYPSPTWVLSYHFSGPKAFSLTAAASSGNHVTTAATTVTDELPRGTYTYIARAVNGSTSTTVETGQVTILPNLANLAGDHRSLNQKIVDALATLLANRAQYRGDVLSYSVEGRSQSFANWDEVQSAYNRARLAVAKELGLSAGRIYIRTGTP